MKNRKFRILVLILALILFGTINVLGAEETINTNEIYIKGELNYTKAYEVLEIVNEEREKQGLVSLKMDESLLTSAMQRAAETSILFEHTRPDGTDCFSINSKMYGENIAAGSSTAEGVMNQWMNSAGHKANILTNGWNSIGIGCFKINGITYWAQCFSPQVAQEPTKIPENATEVRNVKVIDDYITLLINKEEISLNRGETTSNRILTTNKGWEYVVTELQLQSFKWTSSNTKVATVGEDGIVKATGYGTTTITAEVGEKSIWYKINVNLPFKDVSTTAWYYNSVSQVFQNNMILGTTDTTFSPDANLTRGMLVTVLWRMEGSPKATTNQFTDVKLSQYYYNAVNWAASKKVVNGYGNGKFGPNDNITREQLAVMLRNYALYKKKDVSARADLTKFTDNQKISTNLKDGVSWAVAKNIISGKSNGTKIDPKGKATRAEAAAMLTNYCLNIK